MLTYWYRLCDGCRYFWLSWYINFIVCLIDICKIFLYFFYFSVCLEFESILFFQYQSTKTFYFSLRGREENYSIEIQKKNYLLFFVAFTAVTSSIDFFGGSVFGTSSTFHTSLTSATTFFNFIIFRNNHDTRELNFFNITMRHLYMCKIKCESLVYNLTVRLRE